MALLRISQYHAGVSTDFSNSLWQDAKWEQFQKSCGNRVFRIQGVLLIQRKTLLGKKFFEVPRAEINSLSEDFWEGLSQLAKKENILFTRFFPADIETRTEVSSKITDTIPDGRQITFSDVPEIFPEHTLVLDLQKSEEELLAEMKSKGRYNIRLAEKKGVEIFESSDVAAFHQILQETTERDEFSGHPKVIYKKMLENFGADGLLLLARYEGEIIAGGIFLFSGDTATYYYGASSNLHRNVMAPYLVQWRAIQEARKRVCRWYDFLGIAPEELGQDGKAHRLQGVSAFKEKFGGSRVQYAPAFEVIHSPSMYTCIRFLQKIRRFYKK